jgi:DNA-binding FrmR family transcriptional regulator
MDNNKDEHAMDLRLARVEVQLEGISKAISEISDSIKILARVEERLANTTRDSMKLSEKVEKLEDRVVELERCADTVKMLKTAVFAAIGLAATALGTKLLSILGV